VNSTAKDRSLRQRGQFQDTGVRVLGYLREGMEGEWLKWEVRGKLKLEEDRGGRARSLSPHGLL
jgi:hypothetical protein